MTQNVVRAASFLLLALWLSGCASQHYQSTKAGTLSGKLKVQWLEPDKFKFVPDQEDPLTFTRADNTTITPGVMFTDGGSIPRPLWALKNYSPWGYAPAFIVHDWLFEMKRCEYDGSENFDVHKAATVMSEAIKTLMEKEPTIEVNEWVMYSMFKAVDSPIAEDLWNNGECTPQIAAEVVEGEGAAPRKQPLMEYTIQF